MSRRGRRRSRSKAGWRHAPITDVGDLLPVALARGRFFPFVSEGEFYRKVRTGLLPAIRIGRRLYISEAVLREFLRNGGRALPGGWRRQPKEHLAEQGAAK